MKKALIVGINHYNSPQIPNLRGCVDDARAVKEVLERNGDGSVNFYAKPLTAMGQTDQVTLSLLKAQLKELFSGDTETALFYFAGHGHAEATGGSILASDSRDVEDGISFNEVIALAKNSKARNKVILLDSCYSGSAGSNALQPSVSDVVEGMTILTASTADQYAMENDRGGVFTGLLVDALSGAAANLVGKITPGSVYAHIDQSLGAWDQRPVFKTNVKSFVSLRDVEPKLTTSELRRLAEFFPVAEFDFQLDPTYEPERNGGEVDVPEPLPENVEKFALLQKFNRVNLLVPYGAPHMWHAAMQSKSCRLTALGEHYRKLVQRELL